MYQIAVGDPVQGFLVLHGASAAAPAFKAIPHFNFSSDPIIEETVEIQLKGTPAQIDTFTARLEQIIQLSIQYEMGAYSSPQYIRFQRVAGEDYFLSPLSLIFLEANPAGFLQHQTGSKLILLHYTRPNYFDAATAIELPLSGRAGSNILGGYPWINHTDSGLHHGSTVLIKPIDLDSQLPAPLRVSFAPTTAGGANYTDFFFGLYHSHAYFSDGVFFYYYNNISGGSSVASGAAIEGNYKTRTYTYGDWFGLFAITPITSAILADLQGHTYRYILHLFNTHAYTDLYMKLAIEAGGMTLVETEPVHSPPGVGYVMLPPLELPPNNLLWEVPPGEVNLVLYTLRESGAATTVTADCVTLFPLAPSASFYGFYNMQINTYLIDDNARQRHNTRLISNNYEVIAHARVGGPLLVRPGQGSRLFAYVANDSALMPIAHTATLRVHYYPRRRLL